MTTELETTETHRAAVERSATRETSAHVLTEEGPGRYLVSAPGTMMWSFRVVIAPFAVCIFGDAPVDAILRVNDKDPLSWVLKAASIDYVLGKAIAYPRDGAREFMPGDAEEWCVEFLTESGHSASQIEAVTELLDGVRSREGLSAERFMEALVDAGIDDPPACDDWSDSMLYTFHALRCFARLYQAAHPANA